MPCLTIINGIVLAVCSLLSFVPTFMLNWYFNEVIGTFGPIFSGIFGVLVSGILIFKAFCCKDNVQASFVNGIFLAVWSLLTFVLTCYFSPFLRIFVPILFIIYTTYGIFGVFISGILIFGAKQQNPTAILVWIGFAIIGVIAFAVWAVITIVNVSYLDSRNYLLFYLSVCPIVVNGVMILFLIWTIIVAKKARNEICNNSPSILKNYSLEDTPHTWTPHTDGPASPSHTWTPHTPGPHTHLDLSYTSSPKTPGPPTHLDMLNFVL